MTSPAKLDANRRNAAKSTGPKTPEGKARSARNAVTHGLTASHPGEPTAVYSESLAEWVADLRPRGIVERTLAERACRAAWNLRRCDRFEDATSAMRVRDAAETYDLAEAVRVEAVGRRLLARPVRVEDDEESEEAAGYARPGDEDAAALVAELRRTAAGVSWLDARWGELGRALSAPGGWGEPHRFVASRLLGLRLEEDGPPALGRVARQPGSLGAPPGGGSWFDEPALSGALDAAVEAGERGLGDPKALWWDCVRAIAGRGSGEAGSSGPASVKRLKALVRSERAKLARLTRKVLKSRAAEDRAGASDRTMFDESRSISLYLRYATAASRDLHRSILDLTKLREAANDEDRDDGPDPAPLSPPDPPSPPDLPPLTPGPGPDAAPVSVSGPVAAEVGEGAAPSPVVSEKLRNEATAAPFAAASVGRTRGDRDHSVAFGGGSGSFWFPRESRDYLDDGSVPLPALPLSRIGRGPSTEPVGDGSALRFDLGRGSPPIALVAFTGGPLRGRRGGLDGSLTGAFGRVSLIPATDRRSPRLERPPRDRLHARTRSQ